MSGPEIPLVIAATEATAATATAAEIAAAVAAAEAATAAQAATAAAAMETAGTVSTTMGATNPFMANAYQVAVPGLTSAGAGSQAAMLAAQTGEFGLGGLAHTAGSAYAPGSLGSSAWGALSGASGSSISPTQAMMASKMVGSGFGQQQQQGGQSSFVGLRRGQPVNSADPIAALLAPKMKKKERISLL
jgi:hypothetical protein